MKWQLRQRKAHGAGKHKTGLSNQKGLSGVKPRLSTTYFEVPGQCSFFGLGNYVVNQRTFLFEGLCAAVFGGKDMRDQHGE